MVKRMQTWMIFVILSFLMYGLWAFLPKIASKDLDPRTILIFEGIGTLAVVMVLFLIAGFKVPTHRTGTPVAIMAGSFGAVGSLLFLMALSKGNTSVVVTATALYPLMVIVLSSVFLKEHLEVRQIAGIVLALAAMVLFAWK